MIRRFCYSLCARARRARYEFFREVMELTDTALVLDIGVGSDRLASVLSSYGNTVVVPDIDLDRLRRARERWSEASLIVADVVHMPSRALDISPSQCC
jgi:tRNA A58 N-methylase Trm61